MISAEYNKCTKCTKCEIIGNKESIINEFGTILESLVIENVFDVDIVLSILSKVIKDNNLEDQVIDSHKKSINDLINSILNKK